MLKIHLSVRCFPTEDRAKVAKGVTDLFPDAILEGDDTLTATASSLDRFTELLKRQRIRDAARSVLRRGRVGNSTSFRLNKQVASIGKVSFADESHPLGDIEVTIVSDDISTLIDTIAPSTRVEGGV